MARMAITTRLAALGLMLAARPVLAQPPPVAYPGNAIQFNQLAADSGQAAQIKHTVTFDGGPKVDPIPNLVCGAFTGTEVVCHFPIPTSLSYSVHNIVLTAYIVSPADGTRLESAGTPFSFSYAAAPAPPASPTAIAIIKGD